MNSNSSVFHSTPNAMDTNHSKIPSKQIHFSGPYHPQNWSLQNSIMYYITINPSIPKAWKKLIQSCKYFFFKNSIAVFSDLFGQPDEVEIIEKRLRKNIDLNNCSTKFWITDTFRLHGIPFSEKNKQISSIFLNIFRCDAKKLHLKSVTISFDEFLIVCLNANLIELSYVIIKYDDDSIVPFEDLFKAASNLKTLTYDHTTRNTSIPTETVKNLLKTPIFLKTDIVHLNWIPEIFDIDSLFTYIKSNKHTKFSVSFDNQISEVYKNKLEAIIDEILENENHSYKTPYFEFVGFDLEKRSKLLHQYYS